MRGHTGIVIRPAAERFWEKVQGGPVEGCWEWTGAKFYGGYGTFWNGQQYELAHRWSYRAMVAEIPDGLHIDHLCRVRACVNPWHLEPVTQRENDHRRRRSACGRGHPYDRQDKHGNQVCSACQRMNQERRRTARGQVQVKTLIGVNT